jgi:hypothetical protein
MKNLPHIRKTICIFLSFHWLLRYSVSSGTSHQSLRDFTIEFITKQSADYAALQHNSFHNINPVIKYIMFLIKLPTRMKKLFSKMLHVSLSDRACSHNQLFSASRIMVVRNKGFIHEASCFLQTTDCISMYKVDMPLPTFDIIFL